MQQEGVRYPHLEIQDLGQPRREQQPCSEPDAIEKHYLLF